LLQFQTWEKYGLKRNLNFNYCTQYQFLSKTEETKKKEAEEEDLNGKEMRMKGGRRWERKVVKLNSTFFLFKIVHCENVQYVLPA